MARATIVLLFLWRDERHVTDREDMLRHALQHIPWACLALSVAALGCASAAVYDTRLEPVDEPLLYADLDYARVAIDSTEAGIRAVAEIRIQANEWAGQYLELHVPTLHCAADGTITPTVLRRERPVCVDRVARPECGETGADPAACDVPLIGGDLRCVYVVRAEFLLGRIPERTERFTLTFGQRASAFVLSDQ